MKYFPNEKLTPLKKAEKTYFFFKIKPLSSFYVSILPSFNHYSPTEKAHLSLFFCLIRKNESPFYGKKRSNLTILPPDLLLAGRVARQGDYEPGAG